MIKDVLTFAKDILVFMKENPGVGLKIAGAVIAIMLIRKAIKSDKIRNWIKKTGFGLGIATSKFLMAKLGAVLALWVEQLIIDIRICLFLLIDSYIEGLRSDNPKRSETVDKSRQKKEEVKTKKLEVSTEKKKMKAEIKAKKMKNKISGRSNL